MTLIEILQKRDGITKQEAKDLILQTREELINSDGCYADEIIMENLGLEPDYLMDILFFKG